MVTLAPDTRASAWNGRNRRPVADVLSHSAVRGLLARGDAEYRIVRGDALEVGDRGIAWYRDVRSRARCQLEVAP